jgi:acyl dehydratase
LAGSQRQAAVTGSPPDTVEEVRALRVRFDDLPTLVGRSFVGDWFVVDEAKLPMFDEAIYSSDNTYPLDVSEYPDRMVEGFHLLALLDHLVNPLLQFSDGPCVGWNYGLDRVRFVTSVLAGQKIRVKGTVGAVRPKGRGYLVLCQCVMEISGQNRPGMVADWWTYWLPGASRADIASSHQAEGSS